MIRFGKCKEINKPSFLTTLAVPEATPALSQSWPQLTTTHLLALKKKKKKGRFTAWSHTHNFPHCPGWPDPIERRGGGHLSEVTTSLPPWSTSGLSQPHLTNWNRNICWKTNGKSMTGAAQLHGHRAAGRTGVKSCQRAAEQLALPPSLGVAQEAHTQLPSCISRLQGTSCLRPHAQ